jgi:hypothetical protein
MLGAIKYVFLWWTVILVVHTTDKENLLCLSVNVSLWDLLS